MCYTLSMEPRRWDIYGLSDPRTGAIRYVGVTFRGKRRFNEHLSRAVRGGRTHRDCWIRSLIAAGVRPVYEILETGYGDGWQTRECYWIAHHRALGDLTNLTDGGDGAPGYIPTPELRRKWSALRAGVPYAPGRRSAMLGRTHPPEVREKISAAGTGRRHTEASRSKLSAAHTGKKLSEEHRTKLAAAKRGRTLTDEHKRKIAASTANRRPVVCIETGEVFVSITAASRALGVNEASVYQAIRKGCRCKGNHYRFQ